MFQLKTKSPRMMTTAGVLLVILLAAGASLAQGPGFGGQGKGQGKGMPGERGEFRMQRMIQHLDLSEAQQEAIKAIHESTKSEGLQLRKELLRLRNEMKGEMLKDSPSEKTVLELNEKMGALKTNLKANRLKARLAVRDELTPEQQDQMLLLKADGRKGKGHGKGKGMGHGKGMGKGFGQGPDNCGPRGAGGAGRGCR